MTNEPDFLLSNVEPLSNANDFLNNSCILSASLNDLSTLDSPVRNNASPRQSLGEPETLSDIDKFFDLRIKYHNNPLVCFLNINSIRNKIIDLRIVMERCLPDLLVVIETKLNETFKTETLLVNGYKKPIRRDRTEHGGGIMLYVRKGIVSKRVPVFETPAIELLCSELTVSKRLWIVFSFYRPPDSNLAAFFKALSTSLNSALDRYENVIIMGDINIDTQEPQQPGYNDLMSFCDVFGLSNLVSSKTCFTKRRQSSIDIILTNRPTFFQATSVFETGLSDCHCLVATTLKAHVPRLKPKQIKYRSYKNFQADAFLNDVRDLDIQPHENDPDHFYCSLTSRFRALVDKHAPLKTKILRGNTAPFMNKDLQKAIYIRSNLKKKFNTLGTRESELKYKKQRNKCVSLRKKAIKAHFKKATEKGVVSNRDFWNLVKPFLSNKGGLSGNDITLVKEGKVITDDYALTEIFNDHYVNIVEKTSGKKPRNLAEMVDCEGDGDIVRLINDKYKDHPSVVAINQDRGEAFEMFSFQEVDSQEVRSLLDTIDGKKSTGEDQIPAKLVSLAAAELEIPLTNAINMSIRSCKFPDDAKRAAVCPLDKGESDPTVERNFRPVSVLNAFSKIFEKVMKKQLKSHLDKSLSIFIAAYRELYSTQHVLIRLIENWRSNLDNDYIVGAVFSGVVSHFLLGSPDPF